MAFLRTPGKRVLQEQTIVQTIFGEQLSKVMNKPHPADGHLVTDFAEACKLAVNKPYGKDDESIAAKITKFNASGEGKGFTLRFNGNAIVVSNDDDTPMGVPTVKEIKVEFGFSSGGTANYSIKSPKLPGGDRGAITIYTSRKDANAGPNDIPEKQRSRMSTGDYVALLRNMAEAAAEWHNDLLETHGDQAKVMEFLHENTPGPNKPQTSRY